MDAAEFLFQTGKKIVPICDAKEWSVLVQRESLEHDLGLGCWAAGGKVEQILAGRQPVVELECLARPSRNIKLGELHSTQGIRNMSGWNWCGFLDLGCS